ncbi:MAG TPA: DUF4012 domain-containing protein [Acidimicrobiia bacterium]
MAADGDPSRPRRRRRRRWWPYWLVGGILVLAWLAISAVTLLAARHDANAGMDLVRQARSSLTPTDLVQGKGADLFAGARRDFARAHDKAGSPWMVPLRIVPVIGRQVHSIDALTGSAERVVAVGSDAMNASRRQLDVQVVTGPARVQQVQQLGVIAGDSSKKLEHVDLGPSNALIGPLRDARNKFSGDLDKLRRALSDVNAASVGLDTVLKGPSRYLVVAANNAEMRAGSGMWLSAGLLDFSNGRFTMHDMSPTAELALDPPGVPMGGDLAARWGWSNPNQEWRNLMLSPVLPANAELAARMWEANGGPRLDGILVIDPVALQALLAASGPVNVNGRVIDANNVVQYVLHDQYAGASFEDQAQQQRREQLSGIANAAIAAIDQRGWDAGTLVDQLRNAAQGRHVLAWSSNPVEERGWKAAGIDGELPSDSMLVAVLNRGGNKLDQFLAVGPTIETKATPTGTAVTVKVAMANFAPVNDAQYIIGPFPDSNLAPGEYLGILSVDVPADAANVRIDNGAPLVAAGADGNNRVVATYVQLLRGQGRVLTVQFDLPKGVRQMEIEPSARIPGEKWRDGSDQWVDSGAHVVRW